MLAGTGIFRSEDGAATWTKIADDLGTPSGAGVLLIDPKTPSRLFLTAASNGVFRSIDSGVTWTRVKTGTVNDLVMDPSHPDILYAGLQSDGVHKTTDRRRRRRRRLDQAVGASGERIRAGHASRCARPRRPPSTPG